MKTPDEIKKGLEWCGECGCKDKGCPYENFHDCEARMHTDALAYIQQLENVIKHQVEAMERRHDKIFALTKERDAMLEEMRMAYHCCSFCKHNIFTGCAVEPDPEKRTCFEWRGVKED